MYETSENAQKLDRFSNFPEFQRFLFTKPFEKIEETKRKLTERSKILENKLNSQLESDFGAIGEKIDNVDGDLHVKTKKI